MHLGFSYASIFLYKVKRCAGRKKEGHELEEKSNPAVLCSSQSSIFTSLIFFFSVPFGVFKPKKTNRLTAITPVPPIV
jgi:hypothetical protein